MIPAAEQVTALLPGGAPCTGVEPLAGDGSARRFFRVRAGARSYVLCHGPEPEENAAYVRLSRYLRGRGVRVPAVHGVDPARGWVLMDDVGDRSLYAAARGAGDPAALVALYRPVLAQLATLQVAAGEGYDPATGQFAEPYGERVMVAEEGAYFAREFAAGLLGQPVPAAFHDDVRRLAGEGARAPAGYLLHRDFQSRNIHLTPRGPAIIDFQGCRPGPLAYDVAALLLDPYAALPRRARDVLLDEYRAELAARGVAAAEFDAGWFAVGAFRLLQALGAFAKLGGRFGKPGFLEHATAGLAHLREHLGADGRRRFPGLCALVGHCERAWAASPRRPRG